jgi:hypothetical protein
MPVSLLNKAHRWTFDALKDIYAVLPFPLRVIDYLERINDLRRTGYRMNRPFDGYCNV